MASRPLRSTALACCLAVAATLSATPAFASNFGKAWLFVWGVAAIPGFFAALFAYYFTRWINNKVARLGIAAFALSFFVAPVIGEYSIPSTFYDWFITGRRNVGVFGWLVVPMAFFLLVWALLWGLSRARAYFSADGYR